MAVLSAIFLLGLVAPVAAQDATPQAEGATPAIGMPFPYTDPDTGAQAAITIAAVDDPATDAAAGSEPAPGTRYLLLTVSYENTGSGPIETRPEAFVVQDRDGHMWSPTRITRSDDIAVPDLQRVEMAPGDRLSGTVGFQLPADAALARVFYQPESSRLLQLTDLGAPGEPAVGTEVAYQDIETTAQGLLTVTEIQDPFTDAPEGYEPEAGARYVLLTIAIENTGSVPFAVSPSNLLLRDQAGVLWGYTSVNRGDDVVVPNLQSQDLAPGSRISGVVGFQLPADAPLADVLYQPVSGRLLFLARLASAGAPSRSGEVGAAAAPNCAGIDAWYTSTRERIDRAIELSQQAAQMESEAAMGEAAFAFEELAAAQAVTDVPSGATDLNAMLVDVFTRYHEALTEIATAGEDGGDAQAALVAGTNAFNAASRDLATLETQVTDLAASCGVPT